jgi:proteasome lid subunit RPN8/RPN11
MSGRVEVSKSLVAATVAELRAATTTERMVLWLGERGGGRLVVREVFVPVQHARADFFHIPKEGMTQLLDRLRSRRFMVAAQVHTHPDEAFHSAADDYWAIVRHAGALSLVVPQFCQETTADTFWRDAVVFRLSEDDEFVQVDANEAWTVTP